MKRKLTFAVAAIVCVASMIFAQSDKTRFIVLDIDNLSNPSVTLANLIDPGEPPSVPALKKFTGDWYSVIIPVPVGLWRVTATSAKGQKVEAVVPVTSCCGAPTVKLDGRTSGAAAITAAHPLANRGGVATLTAELLADAARQAGPAFESPLELMLSEAGLSTLPGLPTWLEKLPFAFEIQTPYGRAAAIAAEAKRAYKPVPALDLAALNADGVQILVSPSDFTGDSINNVVVLRGGAVIQPLRSDAHDEVISNKLGASRTVKQGSFFFPISAFDPSAPLTIVMVGAKANLEWPMTASMLAAMR